MQSIDLLIIGAGPAGLSTALHLLKLDPGWQNKMLVLEKAAHPRPKLCGGGVTRFGMQMLHELGMPTPLPLPHALIKDARLQYGRRVVHVRGQPAFVVYQRAELDAYLAEVSRRRGVVLQENSPVRSIALDEEGVSVQTLAASFRAKVVVGADGSKGVVRRLLSVPHHRKRVARLLEVIRPAQASAAQFKEHYAVFDFTATRGVLQGYAWDFPSRVNGQPRFNRGVYDSRMARRRPRARLRALLAESLGAWGDDPAVSEFQGHPIHWFSPRTAFARHRLLLVGDAAGADPLFGEGIGPALGYGQAAAQVIHDGFMREDYSFQAYRCHLLRSAVGRYLLLRWAIAAGSYRLSRQPWFMHALWTLGKPLAWFHNRLAMPSG